MSDTIPPAILTGIARAVETIRVWNATMTQARALEVGAHQPGRYTFAGKRRRERLDRALQTLDMFETRARAVGIPTWALYAACGGKPVLEPDAAVWEWRHRRTVEPHATPAPAGASAPPQAGAHGWREQTAGPGAAPEALP